MRFFKTSLAILLLSTFCLAQNYNQLAKLKFRLELPNATDSIFFSFFSPDGERLLLINKESTQVWSAKTGKLLLTFPEKISLENGFRFAWQPNGSTIAQFGKYEKRATARLWDTETGKMAAVLSSKEGIKNLEWNKYGDRILTVSEVPSFERAAEICLWDESGNFIRKIIRDGLRSATFTNDGEKILFSQKYGNGEKPIIIWDIDQWQTVKSFNQDLWKSDFATFAHSPVESPDGKLICGQIELSKGVVCWATDDETPRYYFLDTKETGDIAFQSFSPDSKSFAIFKPKKKVIEIIDAETGKVKATLSNPNKARVVVYGRWLSSSIAIGDSWSPNSNIFLASDVVKQANLWDVQTGGVIAQFPVNFDDSHEFLVGTFVDDYEFFTFHSSGKFLLSVSHQFVRLRNPATGELLQEVREPQTKTTFAAQRHIAAWSPDGSLLQTAGSGNKSILIWTISDK